MMCRWPATSTPWIAPAAAWLVILSACSQPAHAQPPSQTALQSGLQAGQTPAPFNVKDCSGPAEGKRLCYCCRYGSRPVVCIFTRELNDATAALLQQLDQLVAERRDVRLAAFVVYLGETSFESEKQLKDFARQHDLKHTPLTLYADAPAKLTDTYRIAAEASITIMMWNRSEVQLNHAQAEARPSAAIRAKLIGDVRRVLPAGGGRPETGER